MRKLLVSLSLLAVFAFGLLGAFLLLSPGAGAQGVLDGTFTGSVGTSGTPNAFDIELNTPSTVAPGTYEFDITDYASIHNFDLCAGATCTGSNSVDKTGVAGTGSVQWTVNLTPGTYTYQCDVHFMQLHGQFTVSGGTTSTSTTSTTSTTPAVTVKIAKVVSTRKLVTVTAKANEVTHFKAWLLKGATQLATTSTGGTASAQLKLKPLTTLKPGTYTVQVKVVTGSTSAVVKKQIHVM
jgi:uncharacterized membrane protein